jgi:predicted enzyme related to lactoylglutathione lyase
MEVSMDEPTIGWPFWIGIVTDDIERLQRFYADVLGLTQGDVGEDYVQFDLEGNLLELIRRSGEPEYDRPRVQVGFAVADIEATRRLLIERGAEPVTAILGGPDSGNRWAYFRDPDGNVFEITARTG